MPTRKKAKTKETPKQKLTDLIRDEITAERKTNDERNEVIQKNARVKGEAIARKNRNIDGAKVARDAKTAKEAEAANATLANNAALEEAVLAKAAKDKRRYNLTRDLMEAQAARPARPAGQRRRAASRPEIEILKVATTRFKKKSKLKI